MKTSVKSIVTALVLALSIFNFGFVTAKDSEDKKVNGFAKIEGDYALKDDGSLWKINLFYSEENEKIADGFVDIDSDKYTYTYTALKSDGSLWAWGINSHGQFAEVDLPASDIPVKIMENVKEVSGLMAIKNDGTVWTWGGQKFFDATSKVNKPVMIYKGAKSISFSDYFIKIVDNDGKLYLVENTNTLSYDEVQKKKIKISDNVKYVKGDLFIKEDKTLWQIEYSHEDTSTYKTRLVLKNVIYADSADCSNCAIQEDGTLWVWGFSDDNIPEYIKGYPVEPQKIMSNVKYASCSLQSVLIVKQDGSLCGLGTVSPKTEYSIPRILMKDVKEMFKNGLALAYDNTLWRIVHNFAGKFDVIKISDNVKTITEDGIIEKIDGTKWKLMNNTDQHILEPIEASSVTVGYNFKLNYDGSLWKQKTSYESGTYKVEFEKFDDDVKKAYVSDHLIYYIKDDNSLWVGLNNNDIVYAPEKVQALSRPLKLSDGIKEVKCTDPYVFAVSTSGELLVWRINLTEPTPVSTEPKKITEDVESFDNGILGLLGIIKKDRSLWSGFSIDEYLQPDNVKENYADIMAENLVKDFDNIEEIKVYNENFIIKKNGELWLKTDYNSSGMSSYSKFMDNVIYAEAYTSNGIREGIALCADSSLWDISAQEPKKLLDKVKEAHYDPAFKVYAALQEDNSFYVWGHNAFGECGIDSPEDIITEPQKLFDDVTWFEIGYASMKALRKDGTLMKWGLGFPIAHSVPYVINPLNSGNFDKDTIIQHRNFASIGVKEQLPMIVKINDPAYNKDVKVIFNTGNQLILDKSTEIYYIGTFPGFDKSGKISYRITASDSSGNLITSEEYEVEVLKNDIVMFDYTNEEVFVSDAQIFVDGKELYSDVKPVIKDGRTLLPVRALCEAINADVEWDDKSKTVKISAKDKEVSMKIGEKDILVNNKKQSIDVPAIIVSGRTMLPLRAVGEIIGAEVEWNEKDRRIDVSLK